jgi:hypothetical protein
MKAPQMATVRSPGDSVMSHRSIVVAAFFQEENSEEAVSGLGQFRIAYLYVG